MKKKCFHYLWPIRRTYNLNGKNERWDRFVVFICCTEYIVDILVDALLRCASFTIHFSVVHSMHRSHFGRQKKNQNKSRVLFCSIDVDRIELKVQWCIECLYHIEYITFIMWILHSFIVQSLLLQVVARIHLNCVPAAPIRFESNVIEPHFHSTTWNILLTLNWDSCVSMAFLTPFSSLYQWHVKWVIKTIFV